VYPLAQHPFNRNEVLVWDLSHDPRELAGLSAADLRVRMFTRAEDLPEGVERLPVKTIHVNKSPVVVANLRTATPAVCERAGLDMARALAHAQAAPDVATLMQGAWVEVYAREKSADPVDVDEDLYGAFIGNDDRRRLNKLRAMSGEALAEARVAFEDQRLEELLFRYRARNFPSTLSADERARWIDHCSARLHEGVHGAMTLTEYFERIDLLSEAVDERGQEILGALYDYAEEIAPQRR
jgi:exodeoxyribonuclease-1